MEQKPLYGIVGDGRVARHFGRYFDLLGVAYKTWSRRQLPKSVDEAMAEVDVVLVLIKDDAIEDFLKSHTNLQSKVVIHFSGSLVVDSAIGCHPLMAFSSELYDFATYKRIPFVLDEGAPAFKELFPTLPNPHYFLRPEKKALYHALCVMSGNFTTLLWRKCFTDFADKLGLPVEVLYPYLSQITESIRRTKGEAVTGPLERDDFETIQNNLHALQGDEFADIYRAFVRVVQPKFFKKNDSFV